MPERQAVLGHLIPQRAACRHRQHRTDGVGGRDTHRQADDDENFHRDA